MKRILLFVLVALMACAIGRNEADGRGFGGFRGGSGGGRSESFSGSRSGSGLDSFSGSRSSISEGSRSSGFGGWNRGESAEGARGGNVNAGGGRTPGSGPAVGPYGRAIGGPESSRTAERAASSSWQSAFADGRHSSTDIGLAHYSTFNAAGVFAGHSTVYRSSSEIHAQAGFVRGTFGYYDSFHASWYSSHTNCWVTTRWAVGGVWTTATWATVAAYCALPLRPIDYAYGNTVVIQNNSVSMNGQNLGTAQEYATQATTLADQGQKMEPPPNADWQPLGVFALVQNESTKSNNVFQLAVSKDGLIRGNFYDGLLDTATPVYGSVDKKSQRAAWTIGKKNDRVFEAGISNLTNGEAPVLVHIGTDKTQQWMLVRVQQHGDNK